MTTSNPIQILYSQKTDRTCCNINVIKNPTKHEIIKLLSESEMAFDDIVKNTSKSKATVSMHLKSLRKDGIVNYKPHPIDNRKKTFYLSADLIGSITTSKTNFNKNQTDNLINEFIEKDHFEYASVFVHTLKSILHDFNIDINPILEHIGLHIGSYLFSKVYDENLDTFIGNIAQYWDENNLGKLTFDFGDTIKIRCEDCFECCNLQKKGEPVCFLEKGTFIKLFSEFYNSNMTCEEIECYSKGDDACVFELKHANN